MKRGLILLITLMIGHLLLAQTVQGVVIKKDKPKRGVVVWLKKSYSNTETNKQGRFSLDCFYPDDTLVVQVSYRQVAHIPVEGIGNFAIFLGKNNLTLRGDNGEMLIGYEKVAWDKVADYMDREWIEKSGLHTVSQLLKHMSGLEVMTSMWESTIRIRGINSVGSGNDPLIQVDGVEYSSISDVDNSIPVEIIESIKIHKDASFWGARGANGVIEITTIRS